MILAYFYSHLEKYDYNYDNLDLLINNFEERALEYINEFDTIYGKRYDILGGRMISDMEVYEYISSIVDKLLSEKNIIRRLQ